MCGSYRRCGRGVRRCVCEGVGRKGACVRVSVESACLRVRVRGCGVRGCVCEGVETSRQPQRSRSTAPPGGDFCVGGGGDRGVQSPSAHLSALKGSSSAVADVASSGIRAHSSGDPAVSPPGLLPPALSPPAPAPAPAPAPIPGSSTATEAMRVNWGCLLRSTRSSAGIRPLFWKDKGRRTLPPMVTPPKGKLGGGGARDKAFTKRCEPTLQERHCPRPWGERWWCGGAGEEARGS